MNGLVVNLCFHGIGVPPRDTPSDESPYWISQDAFRRTLDVVDGRSDVRLSFDDGNASDIEVALPELRDRGLAASFFVLAGRLDEAGSLGPDDVRTLRDAGMTVGSHGLRHLPWRGMSDADLHAELVVARAQLASVAERSIDEAACPLGRYDRKVLGALRRAGYATVYTSDRALARQRSWLQARFTVRAGDGVEDVEAVLAHRGRYLTRAQDALRIRAKTLR
ncbi:polysaccharide deacetylase family protein [Cellulomonas sp.]|uniref:polysaccharide deacetylase family protein n=1 Tax=Cellulomonas sp. TaxID=40001 RepID=UPI003BA92F79